MTAIPYVHHSLPPVPAAIVEADDDGPAILPMVLNYQQKKAYRARMLQNDPHCIYCGKELTAETATAEHATPQCQGGLHNPWNLFLACAPCNGERSNRDLLKWAKQMRTEAQKLQDKADRVEAAHQRMFPPRRIVSGSD